MIQYDQNVASQCNVDDYRLDGKHHSVRHMYKRQGLMLFLYRIVAQQLITADAMLKKGVGLGCLDEMESDVESQSKCRGSGNARRTNRMRAR